MNLTELLVYECYDALALWTCATINTTAIGSKFAL